MRGVRSASGVRALLVVVALGVVGCQEEDLTMPTAEEIEETFVYRGELEAIVQDRVVELRATQPRDQLRRGGSLWAKVGPYIVLFSDQTRSLFEEHGGLTAVRVITETPGGEWVSRAYLHRNALNQLTWQRALNISGKARKFGTDRPGLLDDLVRWGEEHTDFEYNPEFQTN